MLHIFSGFELACFEHSILELWAEDGKYSDVSEKEISELTNKAILEKVNEKGYR